MRDTIILFHEVTKNFIGSHISAKSLKLKHNIKLTIKINEIKSDQFHYPYHSWNLLSYGAMIIGEIGNFNRFDSAEKILAYAGMPPST